MIRRVEMQDRVFQIEVNEREGWITGVLTPDTRSQPIRVRLRILSRQGPLWLIETSGHILEVFVAAGDDLIAVQLGSRFFRMRILDPRDPNNYEAAGSVSGTTARVVAQMPGKVVRLLARAGDAVRAGQGLAILEAMKMQNEIRSPCAGMIRSVSLQEGGSVSAGQVLFEIGDS